ncbi:tail assembly chaperone [Leuconostoc mesenteroides]|uniref:tail assembly chaperone n=1 Tax=Leuconostoc mesenteroides TaxID=1245 RepID=UPI003D2F2750
MEVTIGKKTSALKFNFKALFNANRDFSNTDDKGNNLGDGATNLFTRILMGDTSVIPDIIKVAGNVDKVSADELFAAVDELTEDGEKIDETLDTLKDELKNSGFFKKSIITQKENIEEALPALKKKEQTEEVKAQVAAVERILKLLNENL